MKKLFGYFKQTGTLLYNSRDLALITLTILLITSIMITIRVLGEDDSNRKTFAQIINNFFEAEDGAVSGNVPVVNDPNASNGKYILLGSVNAGQCTGPAPEPAVSMGLTKLAFCEDFSDPSRINLDGSLNSGQTFTQVTKGNIFNSAPMPTSAFSFANGVMSVVPTHNNYQVNFISTVPTGGGSYKGFALKNSGWYAEIRWKHAACNMSTAFPAFWSMDVGHLYGSKFPILEPDFYEYIGQKYIGAIHNWAGSGNKTATLSTTQAMPVDPTQFFVAGAMAEPNNAAYAWYLNNTRMDRKTASWLDLFNGFASPIMFGSGPNCPYDVDFVRVWTQP